MYKSKKTKVARILTELCLVRIFKLRLICLAVAAKPGKLTCGDAESGRKKEREKRESMYFTFNTANDGGSHQAPALQLCNLTGAVQRVCGWVCGAHAVQHLLGRKGFPSHRSRHHSIVYVDLYSI